ncbi:MAG: flagellar hook-basal body complex protein [Desulfovibrio sp.]|nr:flagellar hook-basal body complex protein [Desulfovibrio sp.]
MNSSLYIGATGMKGLAEGMQVTTNNLANVSTIGFKKQDILFSDVLYQTQASMGDWWNAQDDSRVAIGQVGMGLQVEAVRTSYTQGALESTNNMTDLAINGKGFFQVTDGQNVYYTRAGDFQSDNQGVWRNPQGYALNGYRLGADGSRGELEPVQIDKFATLPPKATTEVALSVNVVDNTDTSVNSENPFFSLLQSYDATQGTPLTSSFSQTMTLYDENGKGHTVTAYFDGAPSSNGSKYTEFVIADEATVKTGENGEIIYPEKGDGLLLAGVLEFDAQGNLKNVSAFSPSTKGSQNLEDWTPATLVNGDPAFDLDGTQVSLNFGLSAENWASAPASAAVIGQNASLLPGMEDATVSAEFPTTAFATTTFSNSYKQNGYAEGFLRNTTISTEGVVSGLYSNGETVELWEIPVCRFTSEDGLRREGNNLFAATEESGMMEMGRAGSENYGTINAYNIENSNVDLAQEMVNMIINQRGFQSNSKVVTTADLMLQKAMEIKR